MWFLFDLDYSPDQFSCDSLNSLPSKERERACELHQQLRRTRFHYVPSSVSMNASCSLRAADGRANRRTSPLPVNRKRFFAPEWVLSLS